MTEFVMELLSKKTPQKELVHKKRKVSSDLDVSSQYPTTFTCCSLKPNIKIQTI